MTKPFFTDWMAATKPDPTVADLVVLKEKRDSRALVAKAIRDAVTDHLVGLEVIERMGGYPKTLEFMRNKLPAYKKVRSGDLGEILASEYIDQCMGFTVPVKRLRWKDDRNTTMRGNDVIAIQARGKRWLLLKAESKSRARLDKGVVTEALEGLADHSGRPNPSSLAFLSSRLREARRDAEATVFEDLQRSQPKADEIEHLVFTFSGNNPTTYLKTAVADGTGGIRCHLVGCEIVDHQHFIKSTFDSIHDGHA